MPMAVSLSEFSKLLWERGHAEANGGNLSIKLGENLLITTPTMMSKGELMADDMVVCNFNGDVIYGLTKPSSEIKSHVAVYRANEGARAIVHSHPVYTCSYAFTQSLPFDPMSPESVFWLGDIGVIEYILPGSPELAKDIELRCKGKYVIMLRNHGLITWGTSIKEAFWRTEVMENHCRISHIISERRDNPRALTEREKVFIGRMSDYLK